MLVSYQLLYWILCGISYIIFKAVELAVRELQASQSEYTRIREMRDELWAGILELFPRAQLNGPDVGAPGSPSRRLFNNLSCFVGKFDGELMVRFLSQRFKYVLA